MRGSGFRKSNMVSGDQDPVPEDHISRAVPGVGLSSENNQEEAKVKGAALPLCDETVFSLNTE